MVSKVNWISEADHVETATGPIWPSTVCKNEKQRHHYYHCRHHPYNSDNNIMIYKNDYNDGGNGDYNHRQDAIDD